MHAASLDALCRGQARNACTSNAGVRSLVIDKDVQTTRTPSKERRRRLMGGLFGGLQAVPALVVASLGCSLLLGVMASRRIGQVGRWDLPGFVLIASGGLSLFVACMWTCAGAYDLLHRGRTARRRLSEAKRKTQDLARLLGEAQAEKSEIERFHQTLMNSIPNPIFYKDAEGLYTGCNRAFEEFLHRSREEIVGASVYDIAPKELAEGYHQADMDLMAQGGIQTYESQVREPGGDVREVLFCKAALTDGQGRCAGLVGTVLDITERIRAESKLKEALEQMERFNRLAVGRESRMIELKAEVNDMARKAGLAPPYNEELVRRAIEEKPSEIGASGNRHE